MAFLSPKDLLDRLMGEDRNGDEGIAKNFEDHSVCKYFLLNFCPHDLFVNTKNDLGKCPKTHSAVLRSKYEEAVKKEGHDFGYPYELLREIEKIQGDCDNQINRAQKRVDGGDAAEPLSADSEEVKKVLEQIRELQKRAEELGEKGQVDEAQSVLNLVKDLEQKKADLVTGKKSASTDGDDEMAALAQKDPQIAKIVASLRAGGSQNQKLRVCDVCGAFLSVFDSNRRLADHFGGKMHLGFKQLRDKVTELRSQNVQPRGRGGSGSSNSNNSGGYRGGGGGDYKRPFNNRDNRDGGSYHRDNRDRDRDRDRDRGYNRGRDRSPDRRGGRDRDRDNKDRDRGRERSRSRERRKSRSRSRSRDRKR